MLLLIYLNGQYGRYKQKNSHWQRAKLWKLNNPTKTFIKGFVAVNAVPTENLESLFGDLNETLKRISETESDVNLSPPIDATVEIEKICISFKTLCLKEKKLIHTDQTKSKNFSLQFGKTFYMSQEAKVWHRRIQA